MGHYAQNRSKFSLSALPALRRVLGKKARQTETSVIRKKLPQFTLQQVSYLRCESEELSWERLFCAAEALGVRLEMQAGDERIAA
jgi:hypothetical protein